MCGSQPGEKRLGGDIGQGAGERKQIPAEEFTQEGFLGPDSMEQPKKFQVQDSPSGRVSSPGTGL